MPSSRNLVVTAEELERHPDRTSEVMRRRVFAAAGATVSRVRTGQVVSTAWILGALEASGVFSVTRPPAIGSQPVAGGVRDKAGKFRDDIRGSVTKDMDDALKSIRDRVKPPRG